MYDAILLAGGTARRLGGAAKPQLDIGGVSLLERAVAAVAGAQRVVVVGPRQPLPVPVRWCRERPVGSGPVAAVAAGLAQSTADVVVLLACDLPWVAPAVPALLAALVGSAAPADLAALVDDDRRINHLAAAWRRDALTAALDRLGAPAGASMRALAAGVRAVLVADPDGWGADCDTWDDVAQARAQAGVRPRYPAETAGSAVSGSSG